MTWRYRPARPLLNLCLLLLSLASQAYGRQVNITIDDQFGDPTTGQVIQYSPPEAWQRGQDCEICTAKPQPITNMHNSTWMDASFFPAGTGPNNVSGQIISASVPFIGTAVYVQVILTGSRSSPLANTDYTFDIDNVTSGVFQRSPNGDKTYQFNQTVFAKTGLSNSLHTLTIKSGLAGQKSLVLLDSVIYTKEVEDNSSSNSEAPATPESQSSSSTNIGIIAGPVVGGVVVVGAILALVYFLRRRGQHRQGPKNDVLSGQPLMGALYSTRGGPGTGSGRNNPASGIDPFIIDENPPPNLSKSGGFYVAPMRGIPSHKPPVSQPAPGSADPASYTAASGLDAFSTRGLASYARIDESRIDANGVLASPPAYSEVESRSPNASRLPNIREKRNLAPT